MTRGALYHHFKNKQALFEAVFMELQAEIGERIGDGADQHSDPWARLLASCTAFLAACIEPTVRRIVIQEAPAVLGPAAWRLADEKFSAFHCARASCGCTQRDFFKGSTRAS